MREGLRIGDNIQPDAELRCWHIGRTSNWSLSVRRGHRNILEVFGIVSPLGLDLALQRRLGSGQRSTRLGQLTFFRSAAFVLGIAPAALAALGLGADVEQSIYRFPEFANVLLATLVALPFVTDLAV
jgi:hypothetical protein